VQKEIIDFAFGAEDGGDFMFKTFCCHIGTPIAKISNSGKEYEDYS